MGAVVKNSVWQSIFRSAFARSQNRPSAIAIANRACGIAETSEVERLDCLYIPNQPDFLDTEVKSGPAVFTKPVLPNWKGRHPITGRMLDYSDIDEILVETKRFLAAGNQISFPNEHDPSATANLGWWKNEWEKVEGPDPRDPKKKVSWIQGRVEVTDPEIAQQIRTKKIKLVSPAVRPEWTDANGNKYGRHIYHVSATQYPVIPGQGGFERIEFNSGAARRVFAISRMNAEGESMSKKLAIALGLAENATEDEMLSALAGRPGESEELSTAVKELRETNKKLQADVKTEKKARLTEYLSTVVEKAKTIGVPLEKEKQDKLEKMLDRDEEAGRELATAYLSACELGAKKSTTAQKVEHTEGASSGKTAATKEAEDKARRETEMLSARSAAEAQGFDVEIVNGKLRIKSGPEVR